MDWKIRHKIKETNSENCSADKYHPIVLDILAKRGIVSEEEVERFFDFDYEKNMTDPVGISGMATAVERIKKAKKEKEKIAIYGDYDADGVTATAVIFETLVNLGFDEIIYYIPDRQTEGYGMNPEAIKYLKNQEVNLVITVDCGVTGKEEVELAKQLGMDVIVTDHHNAPEELPSAVAVINPKIDVSGFGENELAGVGVAFKLAQALYREFSPEKFDQLKWALDLVAVGTIADCVSLLGENRVLTKYGLLVLSKLRRVGLSELFQVGRIAIDENNVPDTQKVAFQIAPRINAAGRMDHANVAYKLLIEKDRAAARLLALELEAKNQERQKITAEIFKEVSSMAENVFKDKKFILAKSEHWPVGVLGLVAGKIAETFRKPTGIFQIQNGMCVGSFRSISEVDIMEVLNSSKELLTRFGGHSQAAGASVAPENLEKLYEKMNFEIEKKMEGKEFRLTLEIDAEVPPAEINWQLVAEIKKMEPFGMGNPEPTFLSRGFLVVEVKIVGNGTKHLKLSLRPDENSPKIFDAIGFSFGEKFSGLSVGDKIDAVYNLSEDEWNGSKKIQLKLIDLKKNE